MEVVLEKENIHTLSSDGELMLTLLAAFAQEESRSASENVKWRIRKNFERGIPTGSDLLGYRFKNGILQVVPEEAEIVKQIFHDFLSGMGRSAIARKLNSMGLTTKQGNPWETNGLYYILRNEKYTGNLLLQKSYSLDHISKKTIPNRGEIPMYYVEDSHEAIIDQDTFDRTQQELKRRAEKYCHPRNTEPHENVFKGMIRCGLCGRRFRRRTVHANSKYKKAVWICPTFDTCGKAICPSQQIPETILIAKTSEVLNLTEWNREMLLEKLKEIQVPGHHVLLYVFQDGHTKEVHWQNPSRRESWTPKMKQTAQIRQSEIEKQERKEEEK